jgi:hypothetical protein
LDHVYEFEDCWCGPYFVESCDYADFLEDGRTAIDVDDRRRLSALVRENAIKGNHPVYLQFRQGEKYPDVRDTTRWDKDELLRSHWPKTVPERIERTLCNLGRMSPQPGHNCPVLPNKPSVAFARDAHEANEHQKYLLDEELIKRTPKGNIALTFKGWERFHELTKGASSRDNPAFVAMWFGDDDTCNEMTALYRDAIEPAIEQAGYHAKRADTQENNDFIMDEILAGIRMAPFVVADFTGNRGGVYLEAGFARGLGLQVIHTCKSDHFHDAHFDIKQISTIRWSTPDELKAALYHRIIATVGEGPYTNATRTHLRATDGPMT